MALLFIVLVTVARPVKELKRFKRVSLDKGQSLKVEFELPVSELADVGAELHDRLDSGVFTLYVGGDSENCLSSQFNVK